MHSTPARFIQSLVAWVALLAPALARAQAAAPLSPDRVTFFTEPNFKGEALTVEAGASVENLDRMLRANQQPWTFAISSVHVEGAARATVFNATGFTGDRLEITRSIPDLYTERRDVGATWDRAIASLTVTGPPRVITAPPPTQVIRPEPPPTTVVVVPAQPPPPTTVIVQEPPRQRLDRRTAELIIDRAYRDVLDRPADPEGMRTYRDRLMNEGWSERQVIEQLQRSSEARSINADEAITKAYRDVLGRDPDPRGLANYRAKWKQGWTQGQIREDLRASPEGRTAYIKITITRVYHDVLNRDPDPAGYATYEKAMRERGWGERELRAALMSGDEYKKLHPRGR